MTPELKAQKIRIAIRIAIAEACGWKMITTKDCGNYPHGIDPNGDRMHTTLIPDYLNDLNAMQDAENAILGPRFYETGEVNPLAVEYWMQLRGLVMRKLPNGGENCSECDKVRATAAQRAEALCRTLKIVPFAE